MLVTRALQGTGIDVEEALKVQMPLYQEHAVEKTTLYHLMLSPVREAGVAEGDDEFDSEICWINEAEALSLLAPKEAVIAERAFRAFSNSAS